MNRDMRLCVGNNWRLAMETTRNSASWTPVHGTSQELVGEREGHVAVVLAPQSEEANRRSQCIVLFGGVVEGDADPNILVGTVSFPTPSGRCATAPGPSVAWAVAGADADVAEREGAVLVATSACTDRALLIGGMDSNSLDPLNDVFEIALAAQSGADDAGGDSNVRRDGYTVHATRLEVMGVRPSPRYRHCGASAGDGRTFIFGGEDGAGATLNDLWVLADGPAGRRWAPIASSPAICPSPRFSASCAAWANAGSVHLVIAGGAFFPEPGLQCSLSDVWAVTFPAPAPETDAPTAAWCNVSSLISLPAPVNGGGCVVVRSNNSSHLCFAGGKNTSTGSDTVTVATLAETPSFEVLRTTYHDAPAGADALEDVDGRSGAEGAWPHWRYLTSVAAVRCPGGVTSLVVCAGSCRHPDSTICYSLDVC